MDRLAVLAWRAVLVFASLGGGFAVWAAVGGKLIAVPGVALFAVLAWFAERHLLERMTDAQIRTRLGAQHRRRTGGTDA